MLPLQLYYSKIENKKYIIVAQHSLVINFFIVDTYKFSKETDKSITEAFEKVRLQFLRPLNKH